MDEVGKTSFAFNTYYILLCILQSGKWSVGQFSQVSGLFALDWVYPVTWNWIHTIRLTSQSILIVICVSFYWLHLFNNAWSCSPTCITHIEHYKTISDGWENVSKHLSAFPLIHTSWSCLQFVLPFICYSALWPLNHKGL